MADVGKAAPGSEVERFVEMNAAIERATDRRESLGPRELATLLNIHGDVELHHAHIERPQSVPDHVLSTIVTLPIKCTSWLETQEGGTRACRLLYSSASVVPPVSSKK